MKQITKSLSLVALVMAVFAVGGVSVAAAQGKKTIRAGITDPLETAHGQGMLEFKKVLEAETGGSIEVKLFPSNQLGTIVEQIENVKQGGQEMSMSTPAWFSSFYPRIDMLELPFLMTSWEQAERLFSSPAFADLSAKAQQASGVRIVGVLPNGFRNVINKRRAVAQVDDLKGLKIRLQNSPVHLATFKALGAVPIGVGWNETYQAVQNGVVDGLENANAVLLNAKFQEVAPFVSNTRHFFGFLLVYVNPRFYDSLTPVEKTAFAKAMKSAEATNLRLAKELDDKAVAGLRAAGAKVNDLTPEALAALRKQVQPVYDEFGPKFQPELEALQKVVGGAS